MPATSGAFGASGPSRHRQFSIIAGGYPAASSRRPCRVNNFLYSVHGRIVETPTSTESAVAGPVALVWVMQAGALPEFKALERTYDEVRQSEPLRGKPVMVITRFIPARDGSNFDAVWQWNRTRFPGPRPVPRAGLNRR